MSKLYLVILGVMTVLVANMYATHFDRLINNITVATVSTYTSSGKEFSPKSSLLKADVPLKNREGNTAFMMMACLDTLMTWELSPEPGNQPSSVSTTNHSNLGVGLLNRGAGINPSAAGGSISSSGWFSSASPTTLADAIANNRYYQFTVPVSPGYQMDITSVLLDLRSSNTGPNTATLRSSVDGFSTDLGTVVVTPVSVPNTINLSLMGMTDTVVFRLYGYGGAANPANNPAAAGTMRIGTSSPAGADDLLVIGCVEELPAPPCLDTLMTWELSPEPGNQPSSLSSTNNSGLQPGTLIRGAGVNPAAAAGSINASGWFDSAAPTTLDYAIANNKYYEFTLDAVGCNTFDVDTLLFILRSSNTGPNTATLRSSADNYSANLGTVTVTPTSDPHYFSAGLTNQSSVTFRLYGYGNAANIGSNPGTAGTMRIGTSSPAGADDLMVTGCVFLSGGAPIEVEAVITNTSCPGGNDGAITLIVSGGDEPYQFDWEDLPGNNNPQNRSGLTAGEYTVTVTDEAGCSVVIMAIIEDGSDAVDPQITCPGNVTIECDDAIAPADTGYAMATDNCDSDPVITYDDAENLNGCGGYTGTITRTWQAEDESGNIATCNQFIILQDVTPPTWDQMDQPQDITVACDNVPLPEILTASDNCDGAPVGVLFINEIHYDNEGADVGEFIEVAGTAGLNLSGYSLVLYNGANPANAVVYNTLNLSGILPDEGDGFGAIAFYYPVNGLQNGPNDGVALVLNGTDVLELLSYEGSFIAGDGPAAGMMAVDMGVAQEPAPPIGLTLQRIGTGYQPGDFVWVGPVADSPGFINANQTMEAEGGLAVQFTEIFTEGNCAMEGVITRTWMVEDACGNAIIHTQTITITDEEPPMFNPVVQNITVECDAIPDAQDVEAVDGCGSTEGIQVWLNELHYDNVGMDVDEFFEIAGPAGIDLANYTVYLYNGANGQVYDVIPLSGILPDEGKGYGAIAFFLPTNGLQNGSPDGLAIVRNPATVVQFLSYEGVFFATNGPAVGMLSVDIGVDQDPPSPIGFSLQLVGTGSQYSDFAWIDPTPNSPGSLNLNQLAGPTVVDVVFEEIRVPGACIGQETITRTWTTEDDCGNVATMTQVITVQDNTPPVANCQNATLFLDQNGNALLLPEDIDNGSFDNCSSVTFSLSQFQFSCSNIGENSVTLIVMDDCGNTATCQATVTVIDNIAPTLHCSQDLIINLNPGLCCAIVSWAEPTATDNCPFIEPGNALFTTSAGAPGNFFNSFAGVTFDLRNDGTAPIVLEGFRVPVTGGGAGANFNVYYTTTATTNVGNQLNPAAWTLLGSANGVVINQATAWNVNTFTQVNVGGLTLAPGQSKGIYIHIANYPGGGTYHYTNGSYTATDGNLTILSNGYGSQGPAFSNTFADRAFVGEVQYAAGGDPVIVQTGGPLSGEELCKDDSPWEVSYRVEDASGNVAECSFTIQVLEYANPKKNLTCNNQVQISLGENCDTRLGADDILEGGPYMCYDDYEVTIFLPNWLPLPSSPFVGRNQIGQCLMVKVTDPSTGNACWGQVCIEDKMPPNMVCTDLTVNCADDIPLAPSPEFFAAQEALQYPLSFLQHGGGTAYTLQGNTLPGGVYFNVTNNSTEPLQVTGFGVRFGDPTFGAVNAPQTMEIYTKAGTFAGFETNPAAWTNQGPHTITDIPPHFQTGTGPLAQLPLAQPWTLGPGETRAFHIWSATACPVFNYFNGTAPVTNGPFTVAGGPVSFDLLGNLFQAGAASMPNIQVNWALQLEAVPVTDNCTPESYMNTIGQGLSYGDAIQTFTCVQDPDIYRRITRVWTATDQQGNSTQCVQQIDIRRSSISSVELPPHFDDLEEVSFDCTGDYPTPLYIDQTRGSGGFPVGVGCGSLQFTYMDKVLEVCQGSYTIIRLWVLHDMCTGEIGEYEQVIKVTDKTPPLLFCPTEHDIKLGTTTQHQKSCTTQVKLPWIQVTDECTTTNNLTAYVWTTLLNGTTMIVNTMNTEGFFVFDLPVGFNYTFTYVVIDDCGNKSECSVSYFVRDNVPPVAICEAFHTVALTDSLTLVPAKSFDDGSYDECTPVTFDARRGTMNAAGAFVNHPCNQPGDNIYQPQVRFYCCDAQSPVDLFVELRVRDAFGNANFCMSKVEVVDKVRPTIWCPDDITIQCGMPFEPTGVDTFNICVEPYVIIKDAFAGTYAIPVDIFGIPADARISDLDLRLRIKHAVTNDLRITLFSPLGRKAEVLAPNSCAGQPVQHPWDIDVTFNDQAYNIAVFNATGQQAAAPFTCTNAKPSIGAFNQGHMQPQGDELKIFNGEPLNSFTNKNLCFTAAVNNIDVATNRISNSQVQSFILNAGLVPGDRILLEYASATGQSIDGLTVGNVYLFQVINSNTIELLTVTGANMHAVAAGSQHMFCASGTWLLVVEDTKPLGGGVINEVCLHIGYVLPTGLRPIATDNTEACGLDFSYQDLGTPDKCSENTFINRRWRVDDQFGNNSTCIQRIYFRDDTPLTVQFPCDVTVNCQNLEGLDATGDVRHNGDCELVGIEHIDHVLVTTDACYKILRTWIVKDWCKYQDDGNVDYPITAINEPLNQITFSTAINALINSRRIEIGDRMTLRYVTSGTTEIPGLIEGDVYSMVRISGTTFRVDYNTTKQQAVNITGQGVGPHIFRYANSDRGLPVTCDVLTEWYPFVDWYTQCCNPMAVRRAWEDDGDGYFTFTQEIKVVDNQAPQWVDCSDVEYCSFEPTCEPTFIELIAEAIDQCTPADQLSFYWSIDLYNDGTVDLEGVTADASGAYPNGTHKIVFKVTDQCGNWNTCTKLFTIRDCKKPTPICINSIVAELMPMTGMLEIPASAFEAGDSHDNCTEYPKLKIFVERLSDLQPGQDQPGPTADTIIKVSCDDRPPVTTTPVVQVAVWVCDEAGNCDYCITSVWVQANMGPCPTDPQSTELFSYITTEDQEGIEEVEVVLDVANAPPEIQMTDQGGWVNFGMIPSVGNYSLGAHKDKHPLNGVSTYDLLLIQKHLLGVKSLDSPYKLIAADVNNNCGISISDIIELRKMILSPGLPFTNNTSWRFVDANYAFPNPAKPCSFPEVKQFANLPSGSTTANFIGVKIGDVSGDAVPNSLLGSDVRHLAGVLEFVVPDHELGVGEEFQLKVTTADFAGIQGYQYTLTFDRNALDVLAVEPVWPGLSSSNFGLTRLSEGTLTTSWNSSEGTDLPDGEVLYRVVLRAKSPVQLNRALEINSRVTRAEAYDHQDDLLDVRLRFEGGALQGGEFSLYQNEPNPFNDLTIIGFNLPESTTATLKVYDATGRILKVVTGEFTQGYNTINLTRTDIRGNGLLYYQLETETHSATRRMILLD